MPDPAVLTAQEAATLLRVSTWAIYAEVRAKRLRASVRESELDPFERAVAFAIREALRLCRERER